MFSKEKINTKKIILVAVLIIIAFLFGILCSIYFIFLKSNNTARIESDNIYIISDISGKITELNNENNSLVKKGEILAKLDSTEYEEKLQKYNNELEELKKELKLSEKNIDNISLNISSDKINFEKAKTELTNANSDYIRYKNAFQDGSVTEKDLNNAIKNLEIAHSNFNSAQKKLQISNNNLNLKLSKNDEKNSEIKKLIKETEKLKLDISHSIIISQVEGTIIKKYKEIGNNIEAGEPLYRISTNNFYVIYETSTKNQNLKLNQEVTLKLKKPDKTLEGKVISIYPTSNIVCIKAPCYDKNEKTTAKIIFNEDISNYSIDKNTKVRVKFNK